MNTATDHANAGLNGTSPAPVATAGTGISCVPCDIPAFCRNYNYRGKLLTEREFADEQRYFVDKMRLHALALHGWGVVCGLQVKPHPYCPEQRLVVEEGLAIDACGREIRVLQDAWIELPQPPRGVGRPDQDERREREQIQRDKRGEREQIERDERREREQIERDERREREQIERDQRRERERYERREREEGREREERDERRERGEDERDERREREEERDERREREREERDERREREREERDERREHEPVLKTLYLCIAYTECETEFAPAPFDECGCNAGSSLKPNRICEGFRLELYDGKPEFWDAAVGEEREADDCREYYREGAGRCRVPGGNGCVPLAVIMDVVPGESVTERQIHVHGHRRQLASTETLDRVVRCILNKLPSEQLTRIDDINWEHGQRYLSREFLSEFVGSHEHPRGFRISFTDKVHAGAINPRTFQALVVFRPEDPAQPRHMEIAPAEVRTEEGETGWCRLHIPPAYARSRLDMRDFDLFITLKCDVITDLRGVAVDGNFIAHRFPTGDNVPGGTFESWIGVRPRSISA